MEIRRSAHGWTVRRLPECAVFQIPADVLESCCAALRHGYTTARNIAVSHDTKLAQLKNDELRAVMELHQDAAKATLSRSLSETWKGDVRCFYVLFGPLRELLCELFSFRSLGKGREGDALVLGILMLLSPAASTSAPVASPSSSPSTSMSSSPCSSSYSSPNSSPLSSPSSSPLSSPSSSPPPSPPPVTTKTSHSRVPSGVTSNSFSASSAAVRPRSSYVIATSRTPDVVQRRLSPRCESELSQTDFKQVTRAAQSRGIPIVSSPSSVTPPSPSTASRAASPVTPSLASSTSASLHHTLPQIHAWHQETANTFSLPVTATDADEAQRLFVRRCFEAVLRFGETDPSVISFLCRLERDAWITVSPLLRIRQFLGMQPAGTAGVVVRETEHGGRSHATISRFIVESRSAPRRKLRSFHVGIRHLELRRLALAWTSGWCQRELPCLPRVADFHVETGGGVVCNSTSGTWPSISREEPLVITGPSVDEMFSDPVLDESRCAVGFKILRAITAYAKLAGVRLADCGSGCSTAGVEDVSTLREKNSSSSDSDRMDTREDGCVWHTEGLDRRMREAFRKEVCSYLPLVAPHG